MDEDIRESSQGSGGGSASGVDLLGEDGLLSEARNVILRLVMQAPSASRTVCPAADDGRIDVDGEATVRLAELEDVKTICELRYAQSIEYRGLAAAEESYRLFCAETEAYVRRNLNSHAYFVLVERGGEVVAMSGLEIADRMPSINSCGKAERSATVVACYTLPQHRGRGYMRQMLSTWSALAPLLGVDAVYLESRNPSMQMLAMDEGYDYMSDKYRLDLASIDRSADVTPPETIISPSGLGGHLPVE